MKQSMTKTTNCQEHVGTEACGKKSTVTVGGKGFCAAHNPAEVAKRRTEREENRSRMEARSARERVREEMLQSAVRLVKSLADSDEQAAEWVARWDAAQEP